MFLEQLSSGFSLQLAATRAATSAGAAAQERISKTVHVRMQDPDTRATVLRERSIRCVTLPKTCLRTAAAVASCMLRSSQDHHGFCNPCLASAMAYRLTFLPLCMRAERS